jgi:hypothetical protein
MSGPDINRPRAGSNGIGQFIIGVSPIGGIPPFDVWSTIVSQYANSPRLTRLIENFADYLSENINFDTFFDLVFNVATAQGYGLDVWGKIVGVTRVLHIVFDEKYFGFDEAGTISANPFNQQPFFTGAPLTENFVLTDDAFRSLIYAKALANISDGSIPAINQILLRLFPNRGNCYVTDGLDMSMTYTFEFVLSPVELAIAEQSGVLPKPTGVHAIVVQKV